MLFPNMKKAAADVGSPNTEGKVPRNESLVKKPGATGINKRPPVHVDTPADSDVQLARDAYIAMVNGIKDNPSSQRLRGDIDTVFREENGYNFGEVQPKNWGAEASGSAKSGETSEVQNRVKEVLPVIYPEASGSRRGVDISEVQSAGKEALPVLYPERNTSIGRDEDLPESIARKNWKESLSRRPREGEETHRQTTGRDPIAAIQKPGSSVASRTEEKPLLSIAAKLQGTQLAPIEECLEGSVLTLTRMPGGLPWKDASKRENAVGLGTAEGERFQLPLLSLFATDPGLERAEISLPFVSMSSTPSKRVEESITKTGDDRTAERPETETEKEVHCTNILADLNEEQRRAVLVDLDKSCLVLAGPGSGKTRVLTHRIAYLVKKFNVSPYSILAVTFTNKAAQEMKERVAKLLQVKFAPDWAPDGEFRLPVGTFHSIAARFLRQHGSEIGIPPEFVICDTSDVRQMVSRLMKKTASVAPDANAIREMVGMISAIKNDNGDMQSKLPKPVYKKITEFREMYDEELRSMKQLDFDDLLLETRSLLQRCPKVLEHLQRKYQFVLVDEWQDTNQVQFDIVSLLSARKRNLFVVGDADQSIYKFRGADSGNLERFSESFDNITRVTLEQNYRSSGCIVAAAQCVIEGNLNRPLKQMTTMNGFGTRIVLHEALDDREEARAVVSRLQEFVRNGTVASFSDVALMYRTNAQSRLLEENCILRNIPYRLLSGTKFYDRQEIRDLVGYLRILLNPDDDSAFRRIVNVPPRGNGKKTVEALEEYSKKRGLSLSVGLDQLCNDDSAFEAFSAGAFKKLRLFHNELKHLRKLAEPVLGQGDVRLSNDEKSEDGVDTLLTGIINHIKYKEYLAKPLEGTRAKEESEKVTERLRNVEELVRAAGRYKGLERYLESVTLMVEVGNRQGGGSGDAVSLMTLHGGKGLEFDAVFITGAEDNLLPLISAVEAGDIEEERRLLYVGMTRAKRRLQISWRAKRWVVSGGKSFMAISSGPSRFLADVADELVVVVRKAGDIGSEKRRGWRNFAKEKASSTVGKMLEWRVGDSVRCGSRGRGTVTSGAPASAEGAWIEVLFSDGTKEFVNTVAGDVELLYSVE